MDWLKAERSKKGITGETVAKQAGISQQFYSLLESGKRRPSVDVAKRIATVLGFEWTKFFEEEQSHE